MILKRYIPIAIVGFFGSLTLFGWFIESEGIKAFIDDDATQWYDIIASFAIFLGALNLLKLQFLKVLKQQSGWEYSVVAIVSFFAVFVIGFFMRGAFVVDIPSLDIEETYFTQKSAVEAVNELRDSGDITEEIVDEIETKQFLDIEKKKAEEKEKILDLAKKELLGLLAGSDIKKREKKIAKLENNLKEDLENIDEGEDINFYASTDNISGSLFIKGVVKPAQWGAHIQTEGGLFKWMFDNIFTPLSATMFALLAFYVASASYRAFRARNFEATLLLLAGIIIMIGRVPLGSLIPSWIIMYLLVLVLGIVVNTYFKSRELVFSVVALGLLGVTAFFLYLDSTTVVDIFGAFITGGVISGFEVLGSWFTGWPIDQPSIFYLPALQEWIYTVPNLAGARAIMIGIGLGIIVTSLRYIFGLEKSYIGDQ